LFFDRKCQAVLFPLWCPADLVRRRRTNGRIESDIIILFFGGARLDIAAAFTLGARARAATALLAAELIQLVI
jgi:hypothetical protein